MTAYIQEENIPAAVCSQRWGTNKCGQREWFSGGRRSGGGSDIQRGSTRLHKVCLSSGFPRLLLYNLACRIVDQSFTPHILCSIIYTSVKSTIIKKTMKALLHSLMWNFDHGQRLRGGLKLSCSLSICNRMFEYSKTLINSISTLIISNLLSSFHSVELSIH